jgi:hypothetical protein
MQKAALYNLVTATFLSVGQYEDSEHFLQLRENPLERIETACNTEADIASAGLLQQTLHGAAGHIGEAASSLFFAQTAQLAEFVLGNSEVHDSGTGLQDRHGGKKAI